MTNLVLTIRFHDARYHGAVDWPPAPARVFQALIAGVARGDSLPTSATGAFEWLEHLQPPVIASPNARPGSPVELFVPNNDADSVGADPARIGEIRTKKLVRPWLLDDDAALVYAWHAQVANDQFAAVVEAAHCLYQLGRGTDMAWAIGETLSDDALAARLADHRGTIHRPHGGGIRLLCPAPGSLDSLITRHRANAMKIRSEGRGPDLHVLFSQPPKPRFLEVAYGSVRSRTVYELQETGEFGVPQYRDRLWAWPIERTVMLIERIRDAAATRLKDAFPAHGEAIRQTLVGNKAEVAGLPKLERVRIYPLPSIGHEHVDPGIRRIAVEVPSNGPLRTSDVEWAFSGLETCNPITGEVGPFALVRTDDHNMLDRYEARDQGRAGARRWQSITAVVLPTSAQRRRIEPARLREEAKGSSERAREEALAREAVRVALRHADVRARAVSIVVERTPFQPRGARAEQFADGSRFAKERLWHVELELSEAIYGPLVIGDGRFLGLGMMMPIGESDGIFAFSTDAVASAMVDPEGLVRAMRRAVMSRVQTELGSRPLGRYFSGHEDGGGTAQSAHLAYQWDPTRGVLLILAPHVIDRTARTRKEAGNLQPELRVLERAIQGFDDLRAGTVGRFRLVRCSSAETEAYSRAATSWISALPYTVNRHRKTGSVEAALIEDVLNECAVRGLPKPLVTVLSTKAVRNHGVQGRLRLDFEVAIAGPVVLGRTRHLGGGLFLPSPLVR